MKAMRWQEKRLACWVVATLTAALFVGWAGSLARAADAITDDTVDAAVAAAKTPAEHHALAAYFTAKAEAATAAADRHARMGLTHPFTGKAHNEAWGQHCKSLIKTYQQQARDYLALAKEQEAAAARVEGQK
jgi:hypothetical protein